MTHICTQRRRIFWFISAVSFAVVFSFTNQVTQTTPFRKRIAVTSSLLFSVDGSSEYVVVSDSDLIRSIVGAKSTIEVDHFLRNAFESKAALNGILSTSQNSHRIPPSLLDTKGETGTVETCLNEAAINTTISQFPQFSLNATAAALRRLAHVTIMENRQQTHPEDDLEETRLLRRELLSSLLQTIGNQVVWAQRSPEGSVGVFALSDILQGLAVLANHHTIESMQPLAELVVGMMERHEVQDLYRLGPTRLVQCLRAIAKLELQDRPLRMTIYTRLLKPDAVSRLPAAFLSHGLWALASIQSRDKESFLLARAFMRRLRKQKVREEAKMADLCRALVACDSLLKADCMEGYEDEASIFGFTTLRAILKLREQNKHIFTPAEMSNIFSAWAELSSGDREDTVISDLLSICGKQGTVARCNLQQLDAIVSSIEKCKVTCNAEILQAAGERLSTLVTDLQQHRSKPNFNPFNPRIINRILRCPVLLNRRNAAVMEPYLATASELFVDQKFLQRCRVGELANFLWFMSISNLDDGAALEAIVARILHPKLIDTCSPKLASRILGTYTSILAAARARGVHPSSSIHNMTSHLFHEYGGHLLTTQLTPAEASTSLYAYAKASYVHDMGIYDHLVSLIASMASKCTARQLTQSLWSCGKMVAWEYQDFEDNEFDTKPPYLDHAYEIAVELSCRENQLSPVDVTQCIWALGRLGIKDAAVVHSFATSAEKRAHSLNAVEISNVLWGLAKLGFDDVDSTLIATLSDRLTRETTLDVAPKAAATVLYALGRMGVRNEELFDRLSQIMTSQIENVSAQSVANALWAHKKVRLRPPKEMLNLWAVQKLEVSGLQFHDPQTSS